MGILTDDIGFTELTHELEALWPLFDKDLEGCILAYANGRLSSSALSFIPNGQLRHDAARSWNAMRSFIGNRHGVWIRPLGPNASYRTYSSQIYFRRLWCSRGACYKAAYPGTSNHGWGLAVDVATPAMAYYIRLYGARFGWSNAEGRRIGEWWHFTYVGGYSGGKSYTPPRPKPKPRDPLSYLTKRERRLVKELERIRARAEKTGWVIGRNTFRLKRAREIKDWLLRQRQRIRNEARRSGWNRADRRKRYHILLKAYKNEL